MSGVPWWVPLLPLAVSLPVSLGALWVAVRVARRAAVIRAAAGASCGGPFACRFPKAREHRAGDRWTCPECSTRYRLTRPVPAAPWRNWAAEHGHWVLATGRRRGWPRGRVAAWLDEEVGS